MLHLTRYATVSAFYDHAGAMLEAYEAEQCLLIGICQTLLSRAAASDPSVYFASVDDEQGIVGVALQTPQNLLVLSRGHNAESLALLVAELRDRGEPLPGVKGPVAMSQAFAECWMRQTGATIRDAIKERLFQLTAVQPIVTAPGHLRPMAEADRPLVQQWLGAFEREALDHTPSADEVARSIDRYLTATTSVLYLWEDGQPVSLAAHSGPTPHGMRIGPVYTPPELRGKGYASACVAALSQMILDRGKRFCFLYTDLANPTSNHIYQAIGYQPVSDAVMIRFG